MYAAALSLVVFLVVVLVTRRVGKLRAKALESDVQTMLTALAETTYEGPVHFAIRDGDRVVCSSEAMAAAVLEACGPDTPIEVLPKPKD